MEQRRCGAPGYDCSDLGSGYCHYRQGQVSPPVARHRDWTAPVRRPGHVGNVLRCKCSANKVVDGYRSENCRTVHHYQRWLEFGGVVGGDADSVAALDPYTVAVGGDVCAAESGNSL